MAHFFTKCMSNTLPTMTILQLQVHATTNLLPRCGITPETIKHLYQCSHKGSRGRWAELVDALQKFLEDQNADSDIATLLSNALLYIAGEINDLTKCTNITLHSDILRIVWSSILLGVIPTSLEHTQQTYFTHIRSKKRE